MRWVGQKCGSSIAAFVRGTRALEERLLPKCPESSATQENLYYVLQVPKDKSVSRHTVNDTCNLHLPEQHPPSLQNLRKKNAQLVGVHLVHALGVVLPERPLGAVRQNDSLCVAAGAVLRQSDHLIHAPLDLLVPADHINPNETS